jgi:hypothetical protein
LITSRNRLNALDDAVHWAVTATAAKLTVFGPLAVTFSDWLAVPLA